ncbi:MAG TPA: primosomal protein N' [Myxococcota bacterium]|nr:primosomal protein N' [Myxococcota bacterium]
MTSSPRTLVQVAVAAPLRRLFTYLVPEELPAGLQPGQLVEVPFGRGRARGVVLGPAATPEPGLELKAVDRLVEPEPVLPGPLLATLRWAADYYLVPPGEMLFAALPPLFRQVGAGSGELAVLVARVAEGVGPEALAGLAGRAPLQARLLGALVQGGPAEVARLEAELAGAREGLRALAHKGLVRLEREPRARAPVPADLPEGAGAVSPTPDQVRALAEIHAALDGGEFVTCLLHGVTGSGKTEVYLRAIARALSQDRGAVLLVPEIALTPLLTQRVTARFGAQVAVLHSGLGAGERQDEWRRLRRGQARVAVGARSAVFAPVPRLGLIIVDEEHDPSYKQSERLPYHGRDLALVRARQEGAVAVLGSATPSLESCAHARGGRYRLLRLPERVHQRPLPEIEVVDLREVLDPLERAHALSPRLAELVAATLDRGEQAILFLNRRGYSSFALCKDCGEAVRCANCSVTLTHHLQGGGLRCHYCGALQPLPERCPSCKRGRMQLFGLGTEKCEAEVRRRFPGARVLRLDSDSATGRGAVAEILGRFARGEADVLVGTQMVTKGHDIPGVTLVGVVLADLGLHLPDFRAAERTLQLLLQVAGRAGRGDRPGQVVVQTFLPQHECVVLARENRFDDFVEHELARRLALGYPPGRRLLLVRASHADPAKAAALARRLAEVLRAEGGARCQVLGPAVSPLARLRGRYRWQLLVKCPRVEDLQRVAGAALRRVSPPAGAKLLFDVDPVDML